MDEFDGCIISAILPVTVAVAVASWFGFPILYAWISKTNVTLVQAVAVGVTTLVFLSATICAGSLVKLHFKSARSDPAKRALTAGTMIGFILVGAVFVAGHQQASFSDLTLGWKAGVFLAAAISGYLVWLLAGKRAFRPFVEVVLLTLVPGVCWYARLTSHPVYMPLAFGLLLGSLLRFGLGYAAEAFGEPPDDPVNLSEPDSA